MEIVRISRCQIDEGAGYHVLLQYGLKQLTEYAIAAADGSPTQAARALHADPRTLSKHQAWTCPFLLEHGGENIVFWSSEAIKGQSLEQLTAALRFALVEAMLHLKSNRAIARFYGVDEAVIRRIRKRMGL